MARDYDAVIALWHQCGPGVRVGRSDAPDEIRKKLQRDPDLFLVAEQAGQVLGTVIGGFDGRRGLMYHLAVAPDRRGQGLGSALMSALEARLKAKGCLKYYLLITQENAGVVDFYRQHGWEVMPVILMGKDIS